MSYLFKFIVQWSQCGRHKPLTQELKKTIDFTEVFCDKQKALYMSESALSTLVLIGQINVGFWVRNGIPITSQARMYTKYSMREFTYTSDIFNVQLSMCLANPDDFLVTYISRWGIEHWANGIPICDYPEDQMTASIVSECLLLLIQLLTETRYLTMVSSLDGFEKTLRSELINVLNFESCTYAQLVSIVPEHITKHPTFDIYLKELTEYTPPSGISDLGTYTLNDKYKSEIDPYYIGLPSSKRYEVLKRIKLHMAKERKVPYEDTFVPVKQVISSLKDTIYRDLYSITCTDTFGIFLKNTLEHVKKLESDVLLTKVIHLIHLCIVNNLNDFVKIFWREYAIVDTEFCHYHSIGSILYSCLLVDNFSCFSGEIKEIFRYLAETAPHVNVNSFLREQTPSFNPTIVWKSETNKPNDEKFEKKKLLAKTRRMKLLRKLAKQQQEFMHNNDIELLTDDVSTKTSFSNTPVSEYNEGQFSEDSCVFCKMLPNSDDFVYFTYEERNICNFSFDLRSVGRKDEGLCSEERKLRCTDLRAVLRSCGHGTHISCLGNHMKTIRSVQSQTTKNIPASFGYGFLYCPVCNSLANSFLPRLSQGNPRANNDFFNFSNFEHIKQTSLSSGFTPHIFRILTDLTYSANWDNNIPKRERSIIIINELLVNTVSNIELRFRNYSGKKPLYRLIPRQGLLTVRLLSDLKSFLYSKTNNKRNININLVLDGWHDFISYNDNSDLLILGCGLMEPVLPTENQISPNKISHLTHLLKRKFHQDLITLVKDLLKFGIYGRGIDSAELWQTISESQFLDKKEVSIIQSIAMEYFSIFLPKEEKEILHQNLDKLGQCITVALKKSLIVFLRRLYILFYVQFPINSELELPHNNIILELCSYMNFFRLPSFGEFISDFSQNDLPIILQCICDDIEGKSVYGIIQS